MKFYLYRFSEYKTQKPTLQLCHEFQINQAYIQPYFCFEFTTNNITKVENLKETPFFQEGWKQTKVLFQT